MGHERLFDYPFDFKEYMEKRLREFEDLEERKYAKAVLQEGLLRIIQETEKKYELLERRIRAELEHAEDKYVVRTTVIRRSEYDPINATWFPMLKDALEECPLTAEELEKEPPAQRVAGYVYLEADDARCASLAKEKPTFRGALLTEDGEIGAEFSLRKSVRYRERIAELYRLFQENSVSWRTFPGQYIEKCYELCIVRLEKQLQEGAKVQGIQVDYGEYEPWVRPDWIVLWNVEEIYYRCAQFPMPCIDELHYEHEFPLEDFGAENGFLIEGNGEIAGLRYESEKIYIITPRLTFTNWRARRIVKREAERSLGYEQDIFDNAVRKSFMGSYLQHKGRVLKTRADLRRQIMAMDLERFIRYEDCRICAKAEPGMIDGDMNDFMEEMLFDQRSSRILVMEFTAAEAENYLNETMVRYIVSEIQQRQAEFRCVGLLI